jgi:hypothetical protein
MFYWLRYERALQNVASCVFVAIRPVTAMIATMDSNRECFLNKKTTVRAKLRRMTWIHLYNHTTSTFSLVRGELDKLTPACVRNAFRKVMILHHPLYVKISKGNEAVTIYQLPGNLVYMILTLIRHLFMQFSQDVNSLLSAIRTAFLACYRPLELFKTTFVSSQLLWCLKRYASEVTARCNKPRSIPTFSSETGSCCGSTSEEKQA